MRCKAISFFVCLTVAIMATQNSSLAQEDEDTEKNSAISLTVGSIAPALEIAEWYSDGKGKFPHVTKFEKGKYYVVEFWATWCGPCIQSMPELARLQEEYADRGVQIISVSDEPADTVRPFLEKKITVGDERVTLKGLADRWCVTSDEDRSTHSDWLTAAGANSLPTSFVVGPDGIIEWIGHPQDLADTLQKVVAGTWDRQQALAERNEMFARLEESARVSIAPGDDFPPLTVEHWFDDEGNNFPAIAEFKPGNFYLVEIWGTWCRPSVRVMPALAKLQLELAEKGLKVICVTDEPVDVIEAFLNSPIDSDAKPFAGNEANWRELCRFWIATDLDESTIGQYMKGTGSSGTPVAFLIGKNGKLEWTGHPDEATLPTRMVANDAWDHRVIDEIKEVFSKAEALVESGEGLKAITLVDEALSLHAKNPFAVTALSRGKADVLCATVLEEQLPLDEAIRALEELDKTVPEGPVRAELLSARFNLLLSGCRYEEICPVFERMVSESHDDPETIDGLAQVILERASNEDDFSPALIQVVHDSLAKAVATDAKNPALLFTLGRTLDLQGQREKAFSILKSAAALNGPNAAEIQEYLDAMNSD